MNISKILRTMAIQFSHKGKASEICVYFSKTSPPSEKDIALIKCCYMTWIY